VPHRHLALKAHELNTSTPEPHPDEAGRQSAHADKADIDDAHPHSANGDHTHRNDADGHDPSGCNADRNPLGYAITVLIVIFHPIGWFG